MPRIGLLLLLLLAMGCGPMVSPPTRRSQVATTPLSYQGAADLFPAELDLVLRINVLRMQKALDASEVDTLAQSATKQGGLSGMIRMALARAKIVWVGLRSSNIRNGDRVLVVEMPRGETPPRPDELSWRRVRPSPRPDVEHYRHRQADGSAATSDIYVVDDRTVVFVSSEARSSVARVLREGPDAERGQPDARGLLAMDYRAAPRRGQKAPKTSEPRGPSDNSSEAESASMLADYPDLQRLVRGIVHLQANADISGKRLDLTARFHCAGPAQANKIARFLRAFRDAGSERKRLQELLGGIRVERDEENVLLRWALPRAAIIAWLQRSQSR